jgi:hypothetical protein
MLIKSNDDVVSFSFQPEDAISLARVPALAARVQQGLLDLIRIAQPEAVAVSGLPHAGVLRSADASVTDADMNYLKSIGLGGSD